MAGSENMFMKLRKTKIYLKEVLILHKETGFLNINVRNKFMIGISLLVSHEDFFGVLKSKLQLLNI